MGLAFGLGYASRSILATLLLIGFVGLVEIVQLFVPGRHARMTDFLIDALAVCIGVASAHFALQHEPDTTTEK
ncbi:MAG: VanZ family protein [Methyloceanibacter sp.]